MVQVGFEATGGPSLRLSHPWHWSLSTKLHLHILCINCYPLLILCPLPGQMNIKRSEEQGFGANV